MDSDPAQDPERAARSGAGARPAPWTLGLWVVLLAALAATGRLAGSGWDAGALVGLGSTWVADPPPPGIPVHAGDGYDGQAYYRLALDPLTRRRADHGVRLDNPPYRQQRILYPLLARAAAGGRPELVPWALIAVNVLGLGLLATLGGALCASRGVPTPRGLLFAALPGGILALQRDLADVTASSCELAALLALERRRGPLAALALSLAVLARETTWIACLALALDWIARRTRAGRGQRPSGWELLPAVVPTLVLAAWQVHLLGVWGRLPLRAGGLNLGPPLVGLVRGLAAPSGAGPPSGQELGFALQLLALLAVLAVALRGSPAPSFERLGFALSLGLLACLAPVVWEHYPGYLRAAGEPLLFGCAVLVSAPARTLLWGALPLTVLAVQLAVKGAPASLGVALGLAIAAVALLSPRAVLPSGRPGRP